MPQTYEHILLARQVNFPKLVVALKRARIRSTIKELLELVELEFGENFLSKNGFPGDDLPVAPVSALEALENHEEGIIKGFKSFPRAYEIC
ncbi:MAG: hypothetical protein CM1200mP39_29000 [Dehalococcoidia bacterium]|nr:MAG: hypothetical protein CM1200mP39_29000 [Dehalococcoidia bacterium]